MKILNPQPRVKSRKCLSLLLGCIGLLSLPLNGWAANVSFTFDANDSGQSTISKTVSGLTLTLENPKCDTTAQPFDISNDGINLQPPNGMIGAVNVIYGCEGSISNSPSSDRFQLRFDQSVSLVSYEIGYVQDITTASFNVTQGAKASNSNLITSGTINFNTPFTLAANTAADLVSNFTVVTSTYPLLNLKTITVDYTPVSPPVSASSGSLWHLLLLLSGMGAVGFAVRKRKGFNA